MICRGNASGGGAGETCDACGGTGEWFIHGCPREFVDGTAVMTVIAAERAKEGRWPNGTGWLNESAGGMEAIEFAMSVRKEAEGVSGSDD